MPNNKKINNILIIRLSAIGDIVMASAIITPLKQKYPDANIYWLAQPESRSLLEHHPDIAGVIPWPRSEWLSLWKAKEYGKLWTVFRAFRQQLLRYNFDLEDKIVDVTIPEDDGNKPMIYLMNSK